jgi:hypothetical protein
MCAAEDGGVRLKMGGMLEAAVFADYWSGDDVFRRMPALDARVALWWIMPDVARSWFRADGEGKYEQRRVWLRPGNSSNVIVPGAGHLVRDSCRWRVSARLTDLYLGTACSGGAG